MPKTATPEEKWIVEDFFFGCGQGSTYRKNENGNRLQSQVSHYLPLSPKNGSDSFFSVSSDGVPEKIAQLQDCAFHVIDSYDLATGGRNPPQLYITGWVDVPDDRRHIYEEDKKGAWQKKAYPQS